MAKQWLTVRNEAQHAEIIIDGQIGKSFWDDSGTSSKEFSEQLDAIPEGKKIVVGINSEGGSIQDGLGIYNALLRREKDVTCRVDGYAVSIASVIALAGSKRISPKSSIWMIHEPWMMAMGNAEDMRKAADSLDKHAEVIVDIYTSRTGMSKEDARKKMMDETWFKGDEAVEMGFATECNDASVALNALPDPSRFHNIPKNILADCLGNKSNCDINDDAKPVAQSATLSSGGNAAAVEINAENTNKDTLHMENKDNAAATPAAQVIDFAPLMARLDAIENSINKPAPPLARTDARDITKSLDEIVASKGNAKAQFEFLKHDWNQLAQTFPVNANTDSTSSALLPNIVQAGAVTFLQSRLAPLNMFSKIFGQGVLHRNVLAVPHVTAAGTAQSNPTDFEDATNFVNTLAAINITPAHIVAGSHITNAQLQNGWDIGLWVESKVGELGDKIQSLVNAVITTGNFGAADFTGSYTGFGMDDLKPIWAILKKAPVKSIMLDGEYYAQFLPSDLEAFNPMATNSLPGWDGFYLNTYWTGATANTIGFACNPQAIGVGAGLPDTVPSGEPGVMSSTITIPGINLDIVNYRWWSKSSRTHWSTFELMFGAAKGDGDAGSLLASA